MKWLNKLQRRFGRFCIENLMLYICITMLAVYLMQFILGFDVLPWITLSRAGLLQGQVWRLVTFIFVPPASGVLSLLLSLYFYYFIGSSLEDAWGTFEFNVYYVCGMLGVILAALIAGYGSSSYLNLSLFLAYAAIYPNNEVLLFYLIPIKVKYLAYLDWALFAVSFLFGSWPTRIVILASLLNYFIFFGPGIITRMRNNRKYAAQRRQFRSQMQQKNRNNRNNNPWQ